MGRSTESDIVEFTKIEPIWPVFCGGVPKLMAEVGGEYGVNIAFVE